MLMKYIIRRLLVAIPTLLIISLLVFWIIQIPDGNIIDQMREKMRSEGQIDEAALRAAEIEHRINDPMIVQYGHWLFNFVQGNLGKSVSNNDKYVSEILGELIPTTIAISIGALIISWGVAIPFGIIAAVRRNTFFDYALTFVGLTAMATPAFIVALIFQTFMVDITGGK